MTFLKLCLIYIYIYIYYKEPKKLKTTLPHANPPGSPQNMRDYGGHMKIACCKMNLPQTK